MAPSLEKVLTFHVTQSREDVLHFGPSKGSALRVIAPLVGGFLRSEGINAEFVQGGSDWVRFDPETGVGHLDARIQYRDPQTTSAFYVSFMGIVKMDPKIQLIFEWNPAAETTRADDHYLFISPVFEVSNAEHKWMEQTAFVGQGHYVAPGDGTQGVEFDVYKLLTT